MNSISLNIVKNIINNKRYDIITEFAHTEFPEKNDLVIFEYTGKDVRAYKDAQNRTCIMCPKNMTVIQEGHVAEAIARGTIFDDAEEINNNAEFIEKTSIPHAALINSGKNTPNKLKPMIAIVIGRMKDDGTFEIGDAERINGNNFVRDLIHHKDKGCTISEVIGNYIDKDPNEYHNIELGRDINALHKEIEDINDTEFENTITDDDIVDSYDDIDIEALEADPFEKNEETVEQEPESDDPVDDDDDNDNTDPDDDNDDIITDDEPYQEGVITAIKTLKHIGYDRKTKTLVTDVPLPGGKTGQRVKVNVKLTPIQPTSINTETRELNLNIKDLVTSSKEEVLELIKHEEGHLAIACDREKFKEEFEKARETLKKNVSKLKDNDHGMSSEEYVADLYSAKNSGYQGAGLKKALIRTQAQYKIQYAKSCKKYDEFKVRSEKIKNAIRSGSGLSELIKITKNNHKKFDKFINESMVKITAFIKNLRGRTSVNIRTAQLLKNDIEKRILNKEDIQYDSFKAVTDTFDIFIQAQTDFEKSEQMLNEIDEKINNNTTIQDKLRREIDRYIDITKKMHEATIKMWKACCVEMDVRIKFIDDNVNEYTVIEPSYQDTMHQEGFLSKKPKKLKPIPRDIIAYITVEMNDITSANDQAMLSGYTCSKIELVDFYLTVLDTQDPRYIVPHNKEYLTYMKRELERLLTQILRIRPINRMDKVWRVNVNYPEDWRG